MTDEAQKKTETAEDAIEAIRLAAEDVGLDFTKALAFMARFGDRDAQVKRERAAALLTDEVAKATKH